MDGASRPRKCLILLWRLRRHTVLLTNTVLIVYNTMYGGVQSTHHAPLILRAYEDTAAAGTYRGLSSNGLRRAG